MWQRPFMADPSQTTAAESAPGRAKRSVGRPRRLTLAAIVDAACDIGLDRLEMALVAERLNTGVATLYSYVRGREHLLQLVAERLTGRYKVEDRGQDWQQMLRDHAAMAAAVFAAMPHLIGNLLTSEGDVQAHIYSRRILTMLESRGFSVEAAVAIYIEVTQLVIGAAVCAERRRILEGISKNERGMAYALPALMGDHRPSLERLIRDVEAGRRA